jgi:hypothetical protein
MVKIKPWLPLDVTHVLGNSSSNHKSHFQDQNFFPLGRTEVIYIPYIPLTSQHFVLQIRDKPCNFTRSFDATITQYRAQPNIMWLFAYLSSVS